MSRVKSIFEFNNHGSRCIYLMTKTFRIYNNYSLYEAYKYASEKNLKLAIYLIEPYEENAKNEKFFVEQIKDLTTRLLHFSEDVKFLDRDSTLLSEFFDVHTVFIDKAYLRFDLDILEKIKKIIYARGISLFTVEANVFVPVSIASDKEEYSARTIRPKIQRLISKYDEEVLVNEELTIAEKKAFEVLEDFIENKLKFYDLHNDPSLEYTSWLSPYLKYGFISPVTIYNKLKTANSKNKDEFLEELIIRRELAYNFVYFNPKYDDFKYLTYDWSYITMRVHIKDKREYLYTKDDYINFRTHDEYFNAAMREMVYLGRMHSYMRMYWCKKIIEWSKTYEEAYQTAMELNNYYFLDGLTPNGYCGVAWCFGKHDRAWTERPIFGKLRYMNDKGLERKFNIEDYVKKMRDLERTEKV